MARLPKTRFISLTREGREQIIVNLAHIVSIEKIGQGTSNEHVRFNMAHGNPIDPIESMEDVGEKIKYATVGHGVETVSVNVLSD